MAVLDEALTYVLANTTGFRAATTSSTAIPVFLNRMPAGIPDEALAMYEPGGAPPLAGLASDVPVVERPRIQLISRAPTYEVARVNAQTIWDAFFKMKNVEVLKDGSTAVTTLWNSAEPVNSPTDMGRDANERDQVSTDFQVTKEMS